MEGEVKLTKKVSRANKRAGYAKKKNRSYEREKNATIKSIKLNFQDE